MANASWCLKFTFRDKKGQTRNITLCYSTDGASETANAAQLLDAAQSTVIALQACSNAHVQQAQNIFAGGAAQTGVEYGVAGDYQSVSQQAKLNFLTTNPAGGPGGAATVTIPAPLESIFTADKVTVDPANANVTALVAALTTGPLATGAIASTRSGLLLATFIGGNLVGKKLSRRWNKFTMDPTLTYAGI